MYTPIATSSRGGGLSPTAGAGIGIAVGALVLGGALVIALYLRNRRRRGRPRPRGNRRSRHQSRRLDGESRIRSVYRESRATSVYRSDRSEPSSEPREPPPTYELDTKSTSAADSGNSTRTHVFEIHHPPKPPSPLEIDGKEKSRISITIQGSPPRHLGFQARY